VAGPFAPRTVAAVGACTRALSGSNDADAALALNDAATLGALRAFGDRLAVRRLFDDPALHEAHRPGEAAAAALYDALALARLDALGVRWLAGVAANLLAHPGADLDGARWLAFELFSGRDAPDVKRAMVTGVRRALPDALVAALEALASSIQRPLEFAPGAAAWARDALRHMPADVAPAGTRYVLPARKPGRDIRRGRYALPASHAAKLQPRSQPEPGGGAAPPSQHDVDRRGGDGSYRVYSPSHDRVVNAAALATREELAQLRTRLEAELTSTRPTIARLAKRLLRVLMARQAREWRFDLEDGLLDGSRLAAVVASRGVARPFKQEIDAIFPSTVITLLIDHSGSMRGRPMRIAAMTVEIFARVLERCGVKCEVLGFTTREWDGGEPGREWAAGGYRENPGRLNSLEHIVVKSADVPWRRARVGLGLFLRDEMFKENIDGEAVLWAHARLMARAERRRILVVISDGTPMEEATLAANGFDYLDDHLAAVVDDIEARSPVQLAAIGIGHDVSRFYRNATRISRIEELGPALSSKLISLLDA
jgi:cobaltochelatase CobT